MTVVASTSFSSVYARALRGETCDVVGAGQLRTPLPVPRWSLPPTAQDRAMLLRCVGPTLDIGCGPGRMSQGLAELARPVLGIDLVPEAVRMTRARGVAALVRDVFEPLPGEGHWSSALLADGNVGIGGDPVRLLRRVAALVAPGGTIVAELAAPGTGVATRSLRLETSTSSSRPFRWTVVGVDSIATLVPSAGLLVDDLHCGDNHWYAVLRKPR